MTTFALYKYKHTTMKSRKLLLGLMVGALTWGELKAEDRLGDTTTVAGDFAFVEASGATQTLHAITAPRVLVYFYDPTCEDCKALMERLAVSEPINRQIDEGRLQVLAIYPDNDSAQWSAYTAHIPRHWINGYDRDLTVIPAGNFLFHSLPALYLLDAEKRFLLQDAGADEVEKELEQLTK